jgi:hypothetical protein
MSDPFYNDSKFTDENKTDLIDLGFSNDNIEYLERLNMDKDMLVERAYQFSAAPHNMTPEQIVSLLRNAQQYAVNLSYNNNPGNQGGSRKRKRNKSNKRSRRSKRNKRNRRSRKNKRR